MRKTVSVRLCRATTCLVASAMCVCAARAHASPETCDMPEFTEEGQQGVYGGAWGRDASAAPGTLLGCRALSGASLWNGSGTPDAFVNHVERAYLIRFVTKDAAARPVPGTGLVLVPKAHLVPSQNQGVSPLMAVAAGTAGVADACAASRTVREGTSVIGDRVAHYLGKGMTVLAVDHLGLGTELGVTDGDDHPYLEGPSAAHVILDGLRAARQVQGARYDDANAAIPVHWPVAISGGSQGGISTLWATLEAPAYAPELPLRASVVGSAPVDLARALEEIESSILRVLYGYFLVGLENATDPDVAGLGLSAYLKPLGQTMLERARAKCVFDLANDPDVGALVNPSLDDLVHKDALLADPRMQAWLENNSVLWDESARFTAPVTPTFAYHGGLDGIAPFEAAFDLFVSEWGAHQGSVALSGDAALPRRSFAFQAAALGSHLTTPALELNESSAWLRYTPYEWVWDSLFGAPRNNPDLSPND